MPAIKPYSIWRNSIYGLTENIQAAKAYTIKNYAEDHGIDPKQISREEESQLLAGSPEYQEILAITKSAQGYAFPFLKFKVEQDASLEDLTDLLKSLTSLKQNLNELPMDVASYAKTLQIDGQPSWMKLKADLEQITATKSSKWIISDMPIELREKIRESLPEEKKKLFSLAAEIDILDNKYPPTIDPGTGNPHPTIRQKFRIKSKSITKWTVLAVIEYLERQVESYKNESTREVLMMIDSLQPECGVAYSDDRYVAFYTRTEAANVKLCAMANWCINRGAFLAHTAPPKRGGKSENADHGCLQLNILDFGVSKNDPRHVVGTTINADTKIVTYSHDLPDNDLIPKVRGRYSVYQHLTRLGYYPSYLVDGIVSTLDLECTVKIIIEDLEINTAAPKEMLKKILQMSYAHDPEENERTRDIISEIIEARILPNLSRLEIIRVFEEKPPVSPFAARMFTVLLKGIDETSKNNIISKVEKMIMLLNRQGIGNNTAAPLILRNVLANSEKTLALLRGQN